MIRTPKITHADVPSSKALWQAAVKLDTLRKEIKELEKSATPTTLYWWEHVPASQFRTEANRWVDHTDGRAHARDGAASDRSKPGVVTPVAHLLGVWMLNLNRNIYASMRRPPVLEHSGIWKWIGAFALAVIILVGVIVHYTEKLHPEWFPAALEATRKHYGRI
jgi:hypothetical protein